MGQQVINAQGQVKGPLTLNYATSLPSSPTDQQMAVLVDSVTAPTYQWMFRYNAGSSNTEKWEFIGGAPASSEVATSEATASTTYVDLTTAGPTFTIPRAGVYEVHFGAWIDIDVTNDALAAVKIGAAATSDNNAVEGRNGSNYARELRITFAASDVCKIQYRTPSGNGTFKNRFLKVRPVRVS